MKTIQKISAYDESVANLQKVTNLTRKETRSLAADLIKIETKTSVDEILKLATAGGRLGLTGKVLVDFTRATDKAFVALNDSLEGTAEEIGITLGKLAGNFNLDEKFGIGQAINKIGSSLNELGANSKAQEKFIVDFTKRLSGLGAQAGLTLPDVQALGALFDETGQSVEIAATTFNKLLPAIGKDTKKFAKVAGLDILAFEKLVTEKPLEALKAVAEGARSSQKGLLGLTKTLENYGIESARAAGIVGILSNNTERLTELQLISNEAFEEGTSLTDEFAIKTETLGARIETFNKKWTEFIVTLDNGSGPLARVTRGVVDFGIAVAELLKRVAGGIDPLIDNLVNEKAAEKFDRITDLYINKFTTQEVKVKRFGDQVLVASQKIEDYRVRLSPLISEQSRLENNIVKTTTTLDKNGVAYRAATKKLEEHNKKVQGIQLAIRVEQELIELLNTDLKQNAEVTEEVTNVNEGAGEEIEKLTGLINLQAKAVSDLNEDIRSAETEEDILNLKNEADIAKEELDRLRRIVSSSIEEFDKQQLDLIEDQTERVIAKEKAKNDKLIELIRSNAKVKGTTEARLTLEQAEAIDKIEANQAAFELDATIKRDKKKIKLEADLAKAEFEIKRTGFKTEEDF